MHVNRKGFYIWRNRISNPNDKLVKRMTDIALFEKYHEEYPNHGYRWLNAFIRRKEGLIYSDNYAHRCCKYAGIKSKSKRFKYRKPNERHYIYPNLLTADLNIKAPMEVIVSDMTAFWCKGSYYELTLYMDLFNNEIVCFDVSTKRGDRTTYINGLKQLIEKKKEYKELKTILHTDQGSVYSSKSYNELLPIYNITHSMSRAGTPTDNASMESINGWIKEEIFSDFKILDEENPIACIKKYIEFFNKERPAYCLGYMTPMEYKQAYECVNLVD